MTNINELTTEDLQFKDLVKQLKNKAYDNAIHGNPRPNPYEDLEAVIKDYESQFGTAPCETTIKIFICLSKICESAVMNGLANRGKLCLN